MMIIYLCGTCICVQKYTVVFVRFSSNTKYKVSRINCTSFQKIIVTRSISWAPGEEMKLSLSCMYLLRPAGGSDGRGLTGCCSTD